jgi:hypothetical protein
MDDISRVELLLSYLYQLGMITNVATSKPLEESIDKVIKEIDKLLIK